MKNIDVQLVRSLRAQADEARERGDNAKTTAACLYWWGRAAELDAEANQFDTQANVLTITIGG